MPAGRPTIYNETILQKTREYIDSCEDVMDEFHKTRGNKTDSYERVVKVKVPTIEGLAVYLKINKDTIQDWRSQDSKKEFSVLIEELLQKQADRLINNGLSGTYNPTIAKVLLTKHGYREGTELTGKDGNAIETTTVMTEEIINLAKALNDISKSNNRTNITSDGTSADPIH